MNYINLHELKKSNTAPPLTPPLRLTLHVQMQTLLKCTKLFKLAKISQLRFLL